ncbi:LysR family transcriptional regulator [Undibacterium sp. TS12]|uniref:LysR family transcriptional regulator n=1 Tax=Undibacterium sp. TS12 TaxID=2908202 RepID=UPI001F4D04D2|nr:LysR family transcriptional regulator [Undibacterium sp. TS12]MCH8622587.1 LysR family transcriptional regulator [Undibacterium sp. TS12]
MDKLRSMEVFVTVVDVGSFTAAADLCNISAVMVGKHIAYLEELLGARLLVRTTRRQSLTELGLQYADQCKAILAQIRDAESGAARLRGGARGLLKITSPVTFGSELLAPAMVDFLATYPEMRADLDLNDRLVDMVEDGFDAAIRIGKLEDSSLIARPLQAYRMMICAAPSYLQRKGIPRVPADLIAHECLDFLHWNKHVRWRLTEETSDIPVSRLRSNNGQALKSAAVAGFGIVMQSELLLAGEVAAGRLVPLMEAYVPAPRPMHLLYPRDRQPTPKLSAFIEFMLDRFGLKTNSM